MSLDYKINRSGTGMSFDVRNPPPPGSMLVLAGGRELRYDTNEGAAKP